MEVVPQQIRPIRHLSRSNSHRSHSFRNNIKICIVFSNSSDNFSTPYDGGLHFKYPITKYSLDKHFSTPISAYSVYMALVLWFNKKQRFNRLLLPYS